VSIARITRVVNCPLLGLDLFHDLAQVVGRRCLHRRKVLKGLQVLQKGGGGPPNMSGRFFTTQTKTGMAMTHEHICLSANSLGCCKDRIFAINSHRDPSHP